MGFFYRGEGLSAKPTPGPRQSPATRVCRGEEERQNERALPPAAGRGIWRPRRRSLPHLPLPLPLIWVVCIKKREDRRAGEITTERMPANQEGQVDFCLRRRRRSYRPGRAPNPQRDKKKRVGVRSSTDGPERGRETEGTQSVTVSSPRRREAVRGAAAAA